MCAKPGDMAHTRRALLLTATCLSLAGVSATALGGKRGDKDDKSQDSKRPHFTLRAQPNVGIAPARVVLTGELTGGANDFEEYYCPTLQWDWGDETVSESSTDCEPYEAGKSEIKRWFTVQHIFRRAGAYKVYLRLKRRDKVLGAASVSVQIQPGASDPSR
jgi:hypothetical protein